MEWNMELWRDTLIPVTAWVLGALGDSCTNWKVRASVHQGQLYPQASSLDGFTDHQHLEKLIVIN